MIARVLYTVILTLVAPVLLYGLFRKRKNKPSVGSRWKEHFGLTPKLDSEVSPIWIHAVSVGEVLAVTPFIKELKKNVPDTPILITTTTPTGAEQAEKLSALATHRYAPVDFPFSVQRFLERVNPSQLIIVETELWPNTIHATSKKGIPITVLNARLSDKSFRGYKKIQPLFTGIANHISQVLCQHDEDADNFVKLGVSNKKVQVTGSIKFDIKVTENTVREGNLLRDKMGIERSIWIAASTHLGEDEKIIDTHKKLLEKLPNALLILVPRHPERFDAVFNLCVAEGLKTVRRTQPIHDFSDQQVYLGDTMGEMLILMQAANVCFIGGSLLGNKVGGHNLLEPAALGKPTIIGPSYYNFLEITKELHKLNATKIIQGPTDLVDSLTVFLTSEQDAQQAGLNAMAFIEKSRGALNLSLKAITKNTACTL
ncbi:3-deoxy-D-manno-octulosonic acid transferase [Vibrio sp. vnigr-6D03]|uniref:lipid IV(A) 3-deoxy-D-manno-octulosonic acid transferase n=1 Tax=Vibrio sp. vnigr-6D03 TaxID=2058088 RepID=UPI000C3397F0|nr:lipid IV(A) 3-deoxy-D-manno-octulosonic acid transferase [Vibrio sp. vnigr-6D03]PKF80191.1 3-deoxy-D-manno-octulosonic acid transferase [Vibrio sp. vnigr-6D03]